MENKPTKVYGMLLESSKTIFLSVQSANSLEEALMYAKQEFLQMNPGAKGQHTLEGSKVSMFSIKSLEELSVTKELPKVTALTAVTPKAPGFDDIFDEMNDLFDTAEKMGLGAERKERKNSIPKIPTPEDNKNALMHLIIKSKDESLLDEHRKSFTEAEIKYIEERIK